MFKSKKKKPDIVPGHNEYDYMDELQKRREKERKEKAQEAARKAARSSEEIDREKNETRDKILSIINHNNKVNKNSGEFKLITSELITEAQENGFSVDELNKLFKKQGSEVILQTSALDILINADPVNDSEFENISLTSVVVGRNSRHSTPDPANPVNKKIIFKKSKLTSINCQIKDINDKTNLVLEDCSVSNFHAQGITMHEQIELTNCDIDTLYLDARMPNLIFNDVRINVLILPGGYLFNNGLLNNVVIDRLSIHPAEVVEINPELIFHHRVHISNLLIFNERYDNAGTFEDFTKKGQVVKPKKSGVQSNVNF